jgi:hypothetical protein
MCCRPSGIRALKEGQKRQQPEVKITRNGR